MSGLIIIPSSNTPNPGGLAQGLSYEPTVDLTPLQAVLAKQFADQYAMQLFIALNSRPVRRSLFRDYRHDIPVRVDAATRQKYFANDKNVESAAMDLLLATMRDLPSLAKDREERGLKVFLVDGPTLVFTVQR